MKSDAEVRLMKRERSKGKTQEQAAARAGMSVRTLRSYERGGKLPSEAKEPRDYRTRANPFATDWPWITAELERDAALQATTLFALLARQDPTRYAHGQLRTLQRQIALWRGQHGPEKEVMFAQVHEPGVAAQSDFTHMTDLGVTIGGVAFAHLLFHLVFVYSNVEAISLCLSESFEALADGIERCLWSLGGVPRQHRTDHLSAALRPLDVAGRAQATARYGALLAHYGMEPTTNNVGIAHENGDIEQSHRRCKEAVDQALRVRGQRDFPTRAAYWAFLEDLVHQRNLTRQARWSEERATLRPLPATPLGWCRELRVPVSQFSTIQVLRNTYSVPSRLIGTTLTVRVRPETIDAYQGIALLFSAPRLLGERKHQIDYRHVIWSLVRKPGAFAHYRFRDDLFPSLVFRQAYDQLQEALPTRADRDYVRLLHLAAATSESAVVAAIERLRAEQRVPTFDAVRDLLRPPTTTAIPHLSPALLDLSVYDRLLAGGARHG